MSYHAPEIAEMEQAIQWQAEDDTHLSEKVFLSQEMVEALLKGKCVIISVAEYEAFLMLEQ